MKRLLVFLVLGLLLAGCQDARHPVVTDYRLQQVGGFSVQADGITVKAVLALDIDNPTKSRYTVESLQAVLYKGSETGRFAEASMEGTAEIGPGEGQTVSVPMDLRILRPLALLGGSLNGFDLSRYTADIDMTVKKGAFRKKIRKERMPLSQIGQLIGKDARNDTK